VNVLLMLCGLLAVVILIEWVMPLGMDPESASAAAAAQQLPSVRTASYVHPPFSAYQEILERPLFFEDRRFPVSAAVEAEPPKPLRLELIGVAIVGATRTAMLQSQADGRMHNLREGDSHDGWELETVSVDNVTFSRGSESAQLPLKMNKDRRQR